MIVSLTLGIVLAVIVGIVATFLVYVLLKKIKASQKAGVIVGLIVGLLCGVLMVMMAGRAVIIQGEADYGTFFIYGAPTYEFSNGFNLALDMKSNETFIINDTKIELVLEEYVYSTTYSLDDYDYNDLLILPLSVTKMPGFKVNYYFDDRPPDEITVSENSSDVTKFWIRTRDSYETEYGPGYYSTDVTSISVENATSANAPEVQE
jgi:hypothetical protein